MAKNFLWEEDLKNFYIKNGMEYKERNSDISNEKNKLVYSYSKENFVPKEKNKYYSTMLLETDPRKIRKMFEEERAKRWEASYFEDEKGNKGTKIINVQLYPKKEFTQNLVSIDDEAVRNKVLERTLSGANTKMAIETLKNFDTSEINSKLGIMQDFSNEPKIIDKYIELHKNGGQFDPNDKNAKEYEKFFSKYEIIEPPVYDPKTGMSALVIGNKDTKEVEIIFGASQGFPNVFSGGEKGKRAIQDWPGNNFKAPLITTGSQKAAKRFTEKIKKDYENHPIYNKGLVAVNGHSKAGGEAIYSTSFVPGIKCLAIDPAPIVDCGPHILNNNVLTFVPNMGNGALSRAEKVLGTEFYTLVIRATMKNDETYKTLAIPAEANLRGLEGYNPNQSSGAHFLNNEKAVDRTIEIKKYSSEVKKILNEREKDRGGNAR